MNINWEMKSLAFHYLDTFSLHKTLYFLQRNVTKRAKVNIEAGYKNWRVHQAILLRWSVPRSSSSEPERICRRTSISLDMLARRRSSICFRCSTSIW